jgi:hypothetical protein
VTAVGMVTEATVSQPLDRPALSTHSTCHLQLTVLESNSLSTGALAHRECLDRDLFALLHGNVLLSVNKIQAAAFTSAASRRHDDDRQPHHIMANSFEGDVLTVSCDMPSSNRDMSQ